MRPGVLAVTAVAAILAAVLVVTIVVASLGEDVITALRAMAQDAWGVVTLIDLGTGLLFAALWIALVERQRAVAVVAIAGLFVLGNLVTAVYLLLRARRAASVADLVLRREPLFGGPGPAIQGRQA
jgi:hypothetical protein